MSGDSQQAKGPIAWMARNSVAANLLMFVIVIGGLMAARNTKQEVFPEFALDIVSVNVPYPGAGPEEVEQGIVLAVEEAVRSLDGVKRVTSNATENMGTISIELLLSANQDKVLADVKNAVDRITSFPEASEEPVVALFGSRRRVISLVLAGDMDRRTMHALAERARNDILVHPDVTQVQIIGLPPLEISIEVPRQSMEAYGLTLDELAMRVRSASQEIPGGSIETSGGEVLVRVADRKLSATDFADIIVATNPTGGSVRLGDIGTIVDGFADTDQASFYGGLPAVRVTAFRVGDETPIKVSEAVKEYAERLRAELPDTVTIATWQDDSVLLRGRIDLLVNNAKWGFLLVVLILALLLDLRLALWVSLGIPISFLGAFLLMPLLDLSVNMITLFALIVTLGMVVDDAIVVGENAFEKMGLGATPMQASIAGAKEMAVPVTFAILTTFATFAPMLFVPGVMGKIFRFFPLVVGAVLLFSLIESFFVLPAHLAHKNSTNPVMHVLLSGVDWLNRFSAPVRDRVAAALHSLIENRYRPFVRLLIRERYVTIAAGFAIWLVSCPGIVGSGQLPFSFMPKLEGDLVTVTARLPYGTPLERTVEVLKQLEIAADEAIADLGAEDKVLGLFTRVGELPARRGPGLAVGETGSHLLALEMELVSSEEREFSSLQFAQAWSKHTPPLNGVDALSFQSNVGPGAGAAVDVQLTHPDTEVLAEASARLTEALRAYSDLTDVENDYATGKARFDLSLKDEARTLGLTSDMVARQVRAAFYGAEALREQRGRNELKVMVRLPERQRASEVDIDKLRIRTPTGAMVPLTMVADFQLDRAPTDVRREEGRRIVNVRAELAEGVDSSRAVVAELNDKILKELRTDIAGLEAELVGEQREQQESLKSLLMGFGVAMFIVYALLAVPFRSYIQPFIIMSAIPFGWVGAIWGHVIMGYGLSLISLFGFIALSGVVVNDSLVLVDAANRFRAQGQSPLDAIVNAGARRFRPILLTSLTTFFGLLPMIFETSVQARFLIPMAIGLGYGVLFATVVVLLLIPALYVLAEDIRDAFTMKSEAHS